MIDFIDPIYILTILFFVLALQRMSDPRTARSGIVYAGAAMLVAVVVTFFIPGIGNLLWIVLGVGIGGFLGYFAAKRVKMTDMPQMVAIFNGMGGGAAAGIAAVELVAYSESTGYLALAVAGALIGSVSFAGSVIAFLKLQGWMTQRPVTFPGQQPTNIAVLVVAAVSGGLVLVYSGSLWLWPFYLLALAYGFLMTLPIGGADMPVVISMYNALTGVAVALDGFALVDTSAGAAAYAMIIAGTLVGAAGSFLTIVMARAMNRSLANVLFAAYGSKVEETGTIAGALKPIDADDAAVMLAYASKVIITPGYGMAVAQAQQKVKELMDALEAKGVSVKFGIHPVAGRMPGHMNVLLAEAGVPVRPPVRPGRDQPRVRERGRRPCHRGERCRQPGRPAGREPPAGDADPRRRPGEERPRPQARAGEGVRRHRERPLLQGQHPHALRRRPGDGGQARAGRQEALIGPAGARPSGRWPGGNVRLILGIEHLNSV